MTNKIVVPMFNRVILRQLRKEVSSTGLQMAPGGAKVADRAEVLAVGPGALNTETLKYMPVDLAVGDIVLINAYLGMRCQLDGQEVIIQKDEEILAREKTVSDGQ